jgi:hypothetical protein
MVMTGPTNSEIAKQFILFDEIGEMADELTYIHVSLPLNLTNIYQQDNFFFFFFSKCWHL